MCTELQNLRIFFFRFASPKISNCLDKIKTGNHKEKAMKSRQNYSYYYKKMLSIDTPSVKTHCNEPELIEHPQTTTNLRGDTRQQKQKYLLEGSNLGAPLLNL